MSFRPRVLAARSLVRLGQFVKSLALPVMRPDDLVEFGRRTYAGAGSVESWAEDRLVDAGLTENERELVDLLPARRGGLLVLGVGGGREAISFARMGFQVTGVDFVPELVRRAEDNARTHGVDLTGVIGHVDRINFPAESFDVVTLFAGMYSSLPTRVRRIRMLNRIRRALRPGGYFLCQFHWDPGFKPDTKAETLRRVISILTLGHLGYEPGDMLWGYGEFIHAFRTESELRSEFAEAAFEVVKFIYAPGDTKSGVLLRKPADAAASTRS
jgi:SAM-dependent methyltransferase